MMFVFVLIKHLDVEWNRANYC